MNPSVPRRLNIFLVENHEDTLAYLGKYLESLGHEVRTARTMDAAIGQWDDRKVDLLICDIGLPDGDGWELMTRLREDGHHPYGIAMSGYSSQSDKEHSHAAGFRHHLIKPFLPEDLDKILSEYLSESAS